MFYVKRIANTKLNTMPNINFAEYFFKKIMVKKYELFKIKVGTRGVTYPFFPYKNNSDCKNDD